MFWSARFQHTGSSGPGSELGSWKAAHTVGVFIVWSSNRSPQASATDATLMQKVKSVGAPYSLRLFTTE